MARRRKSMRDIYAQADRIAMQTATRNWNGQEISANGLKRIDRVNEILHRYQRNAAKHFGRRDYLTNEQHFTPMSRSAYMGLANG